VIRDVTGVESEIVADIAPIYDLDPSMIAWICDPFRNPPPGIVGCRTKPGEAAPPWARFTIGEAPVAGIPWIAAGDAPMSLPSIGHLRLDS
jgi:hypothetical protein